MDEKTEELRDIFVDVADGDTVTESQEETHGSLASEADVEARLRETVAEMRENLDFRTSLSVEELATLVERFYDEDSDGEIAEVLGVDDATVTEARLDLHLLRESDTDAPLDRVRDADDSAAEIADDLGVEEATVRRYHRIVETREQRRRLNDRYRAEFENALQDRELSERLTSSVHEDGLDGATEGQETDIDI